MDERRIWAMTDWKEKLSKNGLRGWTEQGWVRRKTEKRTYFLFRKKFILILFICTNALKIAHFN